MNILYVIGWSLDGGGHISSCLAFVKYLKREGHNVIVFAPDGSKRSDYEAVCTKFIKASANIFQNNLRVLALSIKYRIEVIQSCDYVAYLQCILTRALLRRPLVHLIAGGDFTYQIIPPIDSLAVFSGEQIDGIKDKYPEYLTRTSIICERIDREIFHSTNGDNKVKDTSLTLFMAMRFAKSKSTWIDSIIENIQQAVKSDIKFSVRIAGDGPLKDTIATQAKKINQDAGYEVITLLGSIKTSEEMAKALHSIDATIGHGRGIMEGMSCGKAAIIVGKSSRMEWVSESNIDQVRYFNFSGRHFGNNNSGRSLRELLVELSEGYISLIELGNWSKQYIDDHYNAETGALKFSDIYREVRISITRLTPLRWLLNKFFCKIN